MDAVGEKVLVDDDQSPTHRPLRRGDLVRASELYVGHVRACERRSVCAFLHGTI